MLEHVPDWLGHLLRDFRAGAGKLCIVQPELGGDFEGLELTSLAFANGARMPARFTADGEGISPPLAWDGVPAEARSLALIVEDADSPSPEPLVHAIVWDIDPADRALAEGAIALHLADERIHEKIGRNSYWMAGWLPPDPPTGHGPHRYAFQLFALSTAPDLGGAPGRSAVVKAMAGRVLAAGLLIGTYARGEEAPVERATAVSKVEPG